MARAFKSKRILGRVKNDVNKPFRLDTSSSYYSARMVRSSGIREKIRSSSLKELAKERASKKARIASDRDQSDDDDNSDEDQSSLLNQERLAARAKCSSNSLLSILPKPKNSSSFGPTVRLDKLLKLPERADNNSRIANIPEEQDPAQRLGDDGMMEVDVSKVVSDPTPSIVKDLTLERSKPNTVILPKGKERQKNQITYLAQLGKATELERKEQAAVGRMNKAAARSKYGW